VAVGEEDGDGYGIRESGFSVGVESWGLGVVIFVPVVFFKHAGGGGESAEDGLGRRLHLGKRDSAKAAVGGHGRSGAQKIPQRGGTWAIRDYGTVGEEDIGVTGEVGEELFGPRSDPGDGVGLAPGQATSGGRERVVVIRRKGVKSGADLTEVGDIAPTLAKFLGLFQSRNGQGADQAENGDNNQKLDEGETEPGFW